MSSDIYRFIKAKILPTINLRKIILLISVLVFFAVLFKPVERNIFNFPLRDEEDNITTGTWVFQGKKLYSDIFWQRQPIATIISGAVQQITKPNTSYLLIKRHREFIFFYSLVWVMIITLRFGVKGMVTGIILELVKFSVLGNLFHAESLVMYPCVYITGIIYDLFKNRNLALFDLVLLPVLGFFIIFSRETLLPFVLAAFAITFFKLKNNNRKLLILSGVITLLFYLLIFSPFVSYTGFFKNSLAVNIRDFVPTEVTYSWQYGIISTFLFPVKVLLKPNDGFYIIVKLISLTYLISLAAFLKIKKPGYLLLGFFLLATLNFRPAEFGTFSEGRRFLPWFTVLLWISVLNIELLVSYTKKILLKFGVYIILFASFITFILPYAVKEFSLRPDPFNMWYINYSPYFDYGETIRLLSNKGDSLLVMPQEPLVYWHSRLFSSSPYFFTLKYMYERPGVFSLVKEKLAVNPPDFFYFEGSDELRSHINFIFSQYVVISQNRKPSKLYINKNILVKIPEEKWRAVVRYGFSKPIMN